MYFFAIHCERVRSSLFASCMPSDVTTDDKPPRFLHYWLWLWPGLSLLCFSWAYFDPSAFRKCPQVYWVYALIGFTAAGWSWLRTFDFRYLPPALISATLFGVGAWLFWTLC